MLFRSMSWREEKNRTQNKTGRSLSRILLLGTQSASEITVQNAALTNRQPLVSQSCDPPLFVCAIMQGSPGWFVIHRADCRVCGFPRVLCGVVVSLCDALSFARKQWELKGEFVCENNEE